MKLLLRIDNMKVISFDQFNISVNKPLQFDDQVRKHLEFMLHHLFKTQWVEMAKLDQEKRPVKGKSSLIARIFDKNTQKFVKMTKASFTREMLRNKKQIAYDIMKRQHAIEN